MTVQPESFTHYLNAWNERDPERIRGHLDQSVTDDILFVDPAHTTVGPDQLEKMIRESRAAMPDGEFRLASGIDGHNRRYRYRWELRRNGQVMVPGMDVTTIDENGRIERIDGFFGEFPPLA